VLSPTNPYRGSAREFGDITFGNKNILSIIQAAYAASNDATASKSYDLHPAIFDREGLARVKAAFGSALLP
jgi:hypothetical protein